MTVDTFCVIVNGKGKVLMLVLFFQCIKIYRGESEMTTAEYAGKVYEVNEQGHLIDHEQWDEKWVELVCKLSNESMATNKHLRVIDALRAEYEKTGVVPILLLPVSKETKIPLRKIGELFPGGIYGGSLLRKAGLPALCTT